MCTYDRASSQNRKVLILLFLEIFTDLYGIIHLNVVLRQLESYSLSEQLGNKSRINDLHLPVEGNWCGDNSVWNNYAVFHRDVLRGRRKSSGYLRSVCYQ